MAHTNGIYFALASGCLLLLCNVVAAQNSTTPASTLDRPISCQDATPAVLNGSLFLGTWYEAARKPVGGGVNSEECVQMIFSYDQGNVSTQVTYNIDPSALWINQTVTHNIEYNKTDAADGSFPATFYFVSNGINTTYKILQTDYTSFALICGYVPVEVSSTTQAPTTTVSTTTSASNATNTTVSTTTVPVSTTIAPVSVNPAGAFILTRQRQVNTTTLQNFTAIAVINYSDFNGISAVTQSSDCYENGARTKVPVLGLIMAIVYSLLKFVH